MTIKEYLADSMPNFGLARIVNLIPGERPVVRLDRTIFHPQGGGQKADRGRLGAKLVLHVAHCGDWVDHHVDSVEGLAVGLEVMLELDIPWRRLNSAAHTAGHHLAAVVEHMFPGLKAVAAHHWPGEARVEFEGADPESSISIDDVNARISADIRSGMPVSIEGAPYSSRAIRIGDYSTVPCGGTHFSNLSEVGSCVLRTVKHKSGRVRLSYEVHLPTNPVQ